MTKVQNPPSFDFDSLPIFFDERTVALAPFEGATQTMGAAYSGLNIPDSYGFEIVVFDNELKFDGFLEALALLRERDDRICHWSGEVQSGLLGIVVFSAEYTEHRFTDLRGDRARD